MAERRPIVLVDGGFQELPVGDTLPGGGGGGGASDFLSLTDTPGTYGTVGQMLAVNATTDALEWVDAPSGGASNYGTPYTDDPTDILTSSSAFATKTNFIDIKVDGRITHISFTTATDHAGDVIAAIVSDHAASATINQVVKGSYLSATIGTGNVNNVALDTPLVVQAGDVVMIGVTRTDGSTTANPNVYYSTGKAYAANDFFETPTTGFHNYRVADIDITTSDTLTGDFFNDGWAIGLTFEPVRTDYVPAGGTAGQFLSKIDGVDYNTQWVDAPTGDSIIIGTDDYIITGTGGSTSAFAFKGNVMETLVNQTLVGAKCNLAVGQTVSFAVYRVSQNGGVGTDVTIDSLVYESSTFTTIAGEETHVLDAPLALNTNEKILVGYHLKGSSDTGSLSLPFNGVFTADQNWSIEDAMRIASEAAMAPASVHTPLIPRNDPVGISLITVNEAVSLALRGVPGADGQGVPVGGTTGQVLRKIDGTDYNTEWADPSSGGATTFLSLTDTPGSFGSAGQMAVVNGAGNALEFVNPPTGGGSGGGSAADPITQTIIKDYQQFSGNLGSVSSSSSATKGNIVNVVTPVVLKQVKFAGNDTASKTYELVIASMSGNTVDTVLHKQSIVSVGGAGEEYIFDLTATVQLESNTDYFIGFTDKSGTGSTALDSRATNSTPLDGYIFSKGFGGRFTDNDITGGENFTSFSSSYVWSEFIYNVLFFADGNSGPIGAMVNENPSPSFTGPFSSGDRNSQGVTATWNGGGIGNINAMLNGSLTNNGTNSWYFDGSTTDGVIMFFFPEPVFMDAMRWLQSTTATHGDWVVEAQLENGTWTNMSGTFTLGGAIDQTITFSNAPAGGFLLDKLRIRQLSGTTNSSPWLEEVYFSTDEGVFTQADHEFLGAYRGATTTSGNITLLDAAGRGCVIAVIGQNDGVFDALTLDGQAATQLFSNKLGTSDHIAFYYVEGVTTVGSVPFTLTDTGANYRGSIFVWAVDRYRPPATDFYFRVRNLTNLAVSETFNLLPGDLIIATCGFDGSPENPNPGIGWVGSDAAVVDSTFETGAWAYSTEFEETVTFAMGEAGANDRTHFGAIILQSLIGRAQTFSAQEKAKLASVPDAIPAAQTIQEINTATYSTINDDFSGSKMKLVRQACTVTVEPGATNVQPLSFIPSTAGMITFAAGTGVTIISPDGLLSTRVQGSPVTLFQDSTTPETYHLVGDLA